MPAEHARIKRTGETGGNSRCPAPTHPLYMPGATRHVSTLAPLSAPTPSAEGEQSSAHGGRVGTHARLLPHIHCTCQGTPGQHFVPAERVQRAPGPRSMSARNTSSPENVQNGPRPKPGGREKRHSPPARPPSVERQLTLARLDAEGRTSRQTLMVANERQGAGGP